MEQRRDSPADPPPGPPPGNDPYGYYSQYDHEGYYDRQGRYRHVRPCRSGLWPAATSATVGLL